MRVPWWPLVFLGQAEFAPGPAARRIEMKGEMHAFGVVLPAGKTTVNWNMQILDLVPADPRFLGHKRNWLDSSIPAKYHDAMVKR